MKRLAEKQLSKDDRSDEEGQEDDPQTGFRKANEEVLATRKIRALPKRSLAGNTSVPSTSNSSLAPPASTPKFTSFGGFGSSTPSLLNTTSTSTATFGSSSIFSSTQPSSTSSSATDTAKSLSSFLSGSTLPPPTNSGSKSLFGGSTEPPHLSSSFFSKPPAPLFASTNSTVAPKEPSADPADLKYYTSLRGLNESLQAAIQKALDDDVFADLTVFLERYKVFRTDIQKEFDQKSSSTTTSAPPAKPLSMPTPPAGGFSFLGTTPSSSSAKLSNGTTSGGFTPSIPIPSGGFTFGASATKTTDTKLGVPSPSTSDDSKPSTPGFTFGSSSETSKKAEEDKKDTASSTTAFSGFAKPTSGAFPITFGNTNGTHSSTGSVFGTAFKTSSEAKPDPDKPTLSSSPFTFGAPASGAKPFGEPSSTSSPFSFSKPVGYSFGAPAPSSNSTTSLVFPVAQTKPEGTSESTTGSGTGTGNTGEAEDGPKKNAAESFAFSPDNKHDQEGAGEEDEETAHAIKLKAYVMREDKEKGSKNWAELGYGVFRIKKHKETGARRVLMRSSSTGQILVNFAFHSAFKPILKNKNITFIGHDASHGSRTYTVKLQTAEQATELHQALEREIAAKNENQ